MSDLDRNQGIEKSLNLRLRSHSTKESPSSQVSNQKSTENPSTAIENYDTTKSKQTINKSECPDNLMDFLKIQFKEVKDGIADNGEKLESIKCEFERRFSQLEEKNSQMSNDILTLNTKYNQLEQSIKNYALEIVGVPQTTGENLINIIDKIGATMNVQLNENDIDNIFRVKSVNKKVTEKIVVRFVRILKKQEFLDKRKIKKTVFARELGFNSTNQIFIAESLTKDNNYLSYLARDLVRKKTLFSQWHAGGKVFVKHSENSQPKKITSVLELEILSIA